MKVGCGLSTRTRESFESLVSYTHVYNLSANHVWKKFVFISLGLEILIQTHTHTQIFSFEFTIDAYSLILSGLQHS